MRKKNYLSIIIALVITSVFSWYLLTKLNLIAPKEAFDTGHKSAQVEAPKMNTSATFSTEEENKLVQKAIYSAFHHDVFNASIDGNVELFIHEFCEKMSLEDIPYYLELMESLDENKYGYYPKNRMNLYIHLRWIELDPITSFEHAYGNWDRDMGKENFTALFRKWAEFSPEDADKWFSNNFDLSRGYGTEFDAILEGAALHYPEFVAINFGRIVNDYRRYITMNRIVNTYIHNAEWPIDSVSQWIEGLQEPSLVKQGMITLAALEAENAPESAFKRIAHFHRQDEVTTDYQQSLFSAWVQADAEASANWIEAHYNSHERGFWKYIYAITVHEYDKENAWLWAESIEDPHYQKKAQTHLHEDESLTLKNGF